MNHISKEFLKELFLSGIHKIYEYINSLFQEKLTLIEKIKELEATIFTLKEELKKYKEKEAKTSKNSSKSPSSDPFYKKNNKRNIQQGKRIKNTKHIFTIFLLASNSKNF